MNATQVIDSKEQTLSQLFAEQAAKTPQHIAVIAGENQTSYQDLNEKANQLAHRLIKQGVGPDTLVAIAVERSIEMVIGLLGILKAGGAYVPLDASYPKERLQFMLEETKAPILITQRSLYAIFSNYTGAIITFAEDNQRFSKENPQININPKNLAYVIFTSGSTGKPKGVETSHQAIINRLLWTLEHYQPTEQDSLLYISSIGFDISVWEMLFPLVSGGTLVIALDHQHKDLFCIIELIIKHKITMIHFVPSLLNLFVKEEEAYQCQSIKMIITGGELLLNDVKQECISRFNHAKLFLAYGPTEAAISVTHLDCRKLSYANKNSIGLPIVNTQIYILDRELNPVPIGVIGELYISGDQLARGYLQQPDLTAERFIPNPFFNLHQDLQYNALRLYRTGDLACYLPDGDIEFLGRIDDQIKLKGFRIELGEIETTLQNHARVKQAAVAIKEDIFGEKQLVAYIVQKQDNEFLNQKPRLWPSIAEYFVYDDFTYDILTNDNLRNEYYNIALKKLAKDKIVLDIGTGRDAILARLSILAGAKKVYAVEYLDIAYQEACKTIKSLNLEDKIILIHGDATKVILPEKVDLIVSEIVGPIGSLEGAIVILNHARSKHLKAEGTMIPCRSHTNIAAVKLPENLLQTPLESVPANYTKKIFEQVGYSFDLRVGIENFPSDHILSTAEYFESLDFNSIVEETYTEEIRLIISQDGTIDGFLLWLDLETIDQVYIKTLEEKHCWIPIYFPVFEQAIAIVKGDKIDLKCTRCLSENLLNPDYYIEGFIQKNTGEKINFQYSSKHKVTSYKHNNFYRQLFTLNNFEANTHSIAFADNLKVHLARSLPDYMIPAFFVYLDKLPLSPNGKINRQALPSPQLNSREGEYVAPSTNLEQELAAIWSEVLKIDDISCSDNFFALGGDSIKIIQVISKLRKIDLSFTIKDIISYPTIRSLITQVNQSKNETLTCRMENDINTFKEDQENLINLLTRSLNTLYKKTNIFFIHPSGGMVFWYHDLCVALASSFDCYGVKSIFLKEECINSISIYTLAIRYAKEILKIQSSGSFILCGWSFGAILAYEISKTLIKMGYEVQNTIIIDQDSSIKYDHIINEINNNYDSTLKNNKKEIFCNYCNLKSLLSYKVKGKIPSIIFFASEQLSLAGFTGWRKYCTKYKYYTIGKDHFSILEKNNVNFIAENIKTVLLNHV